MPMLILPEKYLRFGALEGHPGFWFWMVGGEEKIVGPFDTLEEAKAGAVAFSNFVGDLLVMPDKGTVR